MIVVDTCGALLPFNSSYFYNKTPDTYRWTEGARRIFSRGEQIRGCGDESLPAGFRGKAPVGVSGLRPQKPTKNCVNNA